MSGAVRHWVICLLLLLVPVTVRAEQLLVAVATNFVEVARAIVPEFARAKSHAVSFVPGSTGKLYAQISHGAPFDVFLAADQERPELLESEGLAVSGSRFTYAVGRLSLWSLSKEFGPANAGDFLTSGRFRRIAMANPELAPYGRAAAQVLERLGLNEKLQARVVLGENVGQAHALIATGNADLGFVARAQLRQGNAVRARGRWDVPANLHDPIRQDAVRLTRARHQQAAREFLAFLASADTQRAIAAFGYEMR